MYSVFQLLQCLCCFFSSLSTRVPYTESSRWNSRGVGRIGRCVSHIIWAPSPWTVFPLRPLHFLDRFPVVHIPCLKTLKDPVHQTKNPDKEPSFCQRPLKTFYTGNPPSIWFLYFFWGIILFKVCLTCNQCWHGEPQKIWAHVTSAPLNAIIL